MLLDLDNPFVLGLAQGAKPRRKLTVSEWAEESIYLSSERSASPGPLRLAPYQHGMLDAISDIEVEQIVYQTSAQVGKTTILSIAQGYFCQYEPSPQLCAFPTQLLAEAYAVETFDPMVRDSPTLQDALKATGKQTADVKSYPGGQITFVGAQSPHKLAMRPIRVVTGDEIDRWPASAGTEGNPLNLAEMRTSTFWNRKLIWSSTPVHKGHSAVCAKYDASDKRVFKVFCKDCGHKQALEWDVGRTIIYEKGKEREARYCCVSCGSLWSNLEKRKAVEDATGLGGGWEATVPFKGIAGFYINTLYSPWKSIGDMAKAYEESRGNPLNEQTFENTWLGLPWDGDVSASADAQVLIARREDYAATRLPLRACLVTAGVDVQDDRIEVLFVGWGLDDESWLLDRQIIRGDPSTPRVWTELAESLHREFAHPSGYVFRAESVAIDSAGHHTQAVYGFSMKYMRLGKPWYAIRGVPGEDKPLWLESKGKLKVKNAKLWLVGVDDAKSTLYLRYAIPSPGPGYVHIPKRFDEATIEQLTVEHAVTKYTNGFPYREWDKPHGARNEMTDMAVYAMAARSSIQIDLATRLKSIIKPEKPIDATAVGAMFR